MKSFEQVRVSGPDSLPEFLRYFEFASNGGDKLQNNPGPAWRDLAHIPRGFLGTSDWNDLISLSPGAGGTALHGGKTPKSPTYGCSTRAFTTFAGIRSRSLHTGCMRLLVLGGTGFLGRAMVEASLAHGWAVTTFNRGQTGRDLPGVEVVRGDRYDGEAAEALARSGRWDAVIDCSGYVPRNVLAVSRTLAPRVGRYVFVSSVSAYAGWPAVPLTETSDVLECPVGAGPDFGSDIEDGPTRYGYQKAGCEAAARLSIGAERTTVLRPGVVLGPREYVGRLIWWLRRIAAGGSVLAPGSPERAIQPIDVRDVAQFALSCAQGGPAGDFNVTAPMGAATFGELLGACIEVTHSDAHLRWVDDETLVSLGVRQWSEMPLWRTAQGVWAVDSSRAHEAGLRTRPLAETVRDTWAWMESGAQVDGRDRAAEVGISQEKEASLLAAIGVPA